MKIIRFFCIGLLFLSFLLFLGCNWSFSNFGMLDINKILYHLYVPLDGANSSFFNDFLIKCVLVSFILTFIIGLVVFYNHKVELMFKFKFKKFINFNFSILKLFDKCFIVMSIFVFSLSCYYCIHKFDLINVYKQVTTESLFIEENYVINDYVFPENKKNLIHIYVESFENTYFSTDLGGASLENLLPYMSEYMSNNISFSNEFNGGMYQAPGTGWTVAGMLAQTAGVPLISIVDANGMGIYDEFMPGVISIGDILEDEGYRNVFFLGSEATFAGRDKYFSQHGNYEILDYYYAAEKNLIEEDYFVWWGYEDSKLFDFAKDSLLNIANDEGPFNFTMLTTNTHHLEGYIDDGYVDYYGDQYSNVIRHTDLQLYEFIEWIKLQDFYEDTIIVVTGDHLSMNTTFFENFDNYERTIFNLFMNTDLEGNTTNRSFNSFDIFPTVLASLGVEIENDRMGLGTNLFSEKLTLYEIFGREFVDTELLYQSDFYYKNLMFTK